MAEEGVVAATSIIEDDAENTNSSLKRKLDDDVAARDSSELNDDDNDDVDDDDNDDDDDVPAKRPRFDEELASENGHKPEGDNGHTEENADSVADVENAEVAADDVEDEETAEDDQTDGDENENVASAEDNETHPEAEEKVDAQTDNPEESEAQIVTSEAAQQESIEKTSGDETNEPVASDSKSTVRKIEIPNNKVGVLIGKAGETIRSLQMNSGARIQITRDADADPRATTRTVEIVGTLDSFTKAERLIKDVIVEAEAGGSPSLVARGFSAAMNAGSIEVEIPVPGDKVGLVIGRGGDTIKNLQTRSGARIQLIPQNVPGEQQSKEKKIKITGDKKQVELAKELIKEVMNQLPGRPSQFSGNNFSQQGYPPRGPGGGSHWANRGPPHQSMTYEYHQRGPYPSQNQQYPQSYGNYPYQGPPRSNLGSGWEHRPPHQGPPHSGGHEYYGQGGGPHSAHMSGHASGPPMAPPHSQGNYNYGQPRGADYGHPARFSQSAPPTQNYGQGYGDPKYNAQAPLQQPPYGGQGYAPPQQGYAPPPQQQYARPPPYGMPPSQGASNPQGAYAPPAASQPVDTPYQAPVPGATQPHQQYPYAPPGPTSQPPYGAAPVTNDAYAQPQQPAAYTQPGAQAQPVPAYGQPGSQAQSVPAYGQQAAGYAQAGPQTGYGYPGQVDPSGYGYQQGQTDPSGYAASGAYTGAPAPAPAAQAGYAQPVAGAQPGYDQSAVAPQGGAYAAAAPAAAQPQPGYPQYDASQQMYAAPR